MDQILKYVNTPSPELELQYFEILYSSLAKYPDTMHDCFKILNKFLMKQDDHSILGNSENFNAFLAHVVTQEELLCQTYCFIASHFLRAGVTQDFLNMLLQKNTFTSTAMAVSLQFQWMYKLIKSEHATQDDLQFTMTFLSGILNNEVNQDNIDPESKRCNILIFTWAVLGLLACLLSVSVDVGQLFTTEMSVKWLNSILFAAHWII